MNERGLSWAPTVAIALIVQTAAVSFFIGTMYSSIQTNSRRLDQLEHNGSPVLLAMQAQITALKEEVDRNVAAGRFDNNRVH